MTFVRPPLELEPPDRDTLEGRASLALKIIAALNGFGVVLAFFPPADPPAQLETVMFNAASALLVVLLLAEARGLDRLRPWAFAAVRPLLVVIVLAGTYQLIVALLDGKVRIPFDAGLAIWSLLAGRHELETTASDRRGIGVPAAAAVLSAGMLFASPLFSWGGALDVRPAALRGSMTVDCGTASPDGTPPDAITITYDWAWTASSPMPDGVDAIVVGWDGNDGLGRPLYLLGRTPDVVPGLYSGRRVPPSRDMGLAAFPDLQAKWAWGVELGERGYEPGHLAFQLERAQVAPPDAEPVTIKLGYIHLGVWQQDVEPVVCSW